MMVELAVALTLTLGGFGILLATARRLSAAARILMTLPIGAAVYMLIALVWVVMTDRVEPLPALLVTGVIGLAGMVAALVKDGRGVWKEALLLTAGVGATVLITRTIHLATLSPDSLRYILFSTHLTGLDGINAVHPPDLMNRQIGYPSLQTLSTITDRQYLASIGPLFGFSALGFLGWMLWTNTKAQPKRLLVVLIACAFLLSTNRFPYSWFYVNTHIFLAAYLLIAVAGIWLAVKDHEDSWAWPVGISLGAIILLRPDSPLFAAVMLVVVAATPLGWRFRLPAVVPISVLTALWYGLILYPHPHFQSFMSLTSPVAGNALAIGAGVAAVILAGIAMLRPIARHLDAAMLVVMTLGFGFLAWRDLEMVGDTAKATVMNVEFGAWLFTWPALAALTVVAVFRHHIPHGRLWTVPVLAFFLLYWILPLLREGAWRVGTGDSGNRILIHFVAVVVGFIALATVQPHEAEAG